MESCDTVVNFFLGLAFFDIKWLETKQNGCEEFGETQGCSKDKHSSLCYAYEMSK